MWTTPNWRSRSRTDIDHINAVDINIKLNLEDTKDNLLAFVGCVGYHIGPHTHTDQYLLFDSLHPLQYKLWVIRTLNNEAERIPTCVEAKRKEDSHQETSHKCNIMVYSTVTDTVSSAQHATRRYADLNTSKETFLYYVICMLTTNKF